MRSCTTLVRLAARATLAAALAAGTAQCSRQSGSESPAEPTPPESSAAAPQPPLRGRILTTVDGRSIPLTSPDRCATVLIFTSSSCPVSNAFAPEISRLAREFHPRRIEFILVHTESTMTAKSARQHAAEFALTCPIVIDSGRELTDATGATITPEVVVLSPTGDILYRGRIDDRFPEIGRQRPAPLHTDLRNALEALDAGRPVPVARTEAVGCFIEPPPQ